MARYLISICLLRDPLLFFLAIKITIELSQYNLNWRKIESTMPNMKIKLFNNTPCKTASNQDINLTCIVDVTFKVCCALLQGMLALTRIKPYPKVAFHEPM